MVDGARGRTSRASRRSGTKSRSRFGAGGAFLCGAFSIADCFYAPVAFRFQTYGVDAGGRGRRLSATRCSRIRSLREWEAAALAETTIIDADEPRIIYRDKLAAAGGSSRRWPTPALDSAAGHAFAPRRRRGAPLRIRGGGTKDFYGGALAGESLDTRAYAGIVDYEPTELVITARAGTPLADDRERDARARPDARVRAAALRAGGDARRRVAAGLSGPRRPYAGAVRDFVLGVRVLDGTGEDLSFGGR